MLLYFRNNHCVQIKIANRFVEKCFDYAPNFEEVEGGILVWASASVRPLCFAYGQERLEIGS